MSFFIIGRAKFSKFLASIFTIHKQKNVGLLKQFSLPFRHSSANCFCASSPCTHKGQRSLHLCFLFKFSFSEVVVARAYIFKAVENPATMALQTVQLIFGNIKI